MVTSCAGRGISSCASHHSLNLSHFGAYALTVAAATLTLTSRVMERAKRCMMLVAPPNDPFTSSSSLFEGARRQPGERLARPRLRLAVETQFLRHPLKVWRRPPGSCSIAAVARGGDTESHYAATAKIGGGLLAHARALHHLLHALQFPYFAYEGGGGLG